MTLSEFSAYLSRTGQNWQAGDNILACDSPNDSYDYVTKYAQGWQVLSLDVLSSRLITEEWS